jgi:Spy/CpxP family protein refolding chaperone
MPEVALTFAHAIASSLALNPVGTLASFAQRARTSTHDNGGDTMNKQAVTALSIVFLALTGAAAAGAQAGEGHSEHHKYRLHPGAGIHEGGDPALMVKHLTRKLDLDRTQQQEIENIVSAAQPEMDALRERAEANRRAMHELDVDDSNHDARLNALAAERGAIVSEQTLLHGRMKADISAVLTPEQRQELASGARKMHERFRKRNDGRS